MYATCSHGLGAVSIQSEEENAIDSSVHRKNRIGG